ncbi:unnamed protein product [Hymenolepis diminuta]|uniref:Uncharacterized protein n=1 Tax=Hymenolepis diminuta TaxID=6216 RepID=A0A564YUF4_HYMDI|nr:unnamed protein product [Hymenolepis diminuta]
MTFNVAYFMWMFVFFIRKKLDIAAIVVIAFALTTLLVFVSITRVFRKSTYCLFPSVLWLTLLAFASFDMASLNPEYLSFAPSNRTVF